jgi:hypothetical protein
MNTNTNASAAWLAAILRDFAIVVAVIVYVIDTLWTTLKTRDRPRAWNPLLAADAERASSVSQGEGAHACIARRARRGHEGRADERQRHASRIAKRVAWNVHPRNIRFARRVGLPPVPNAKPDVARAGLWPPCGAKAKAGIGSTNARIA